MNSDIINSLLKSSRENLLMYGELTPFGFLIKGNQIVNSIILDMSADKYESVFQAGAIARMKNADALILIMEGAYRRFETEEEVKYAMEHYDTEAPLTYPKSMRQEVVICTCVEFPSMKISGSAMNFNGDFPKFKFEEPTEMPEMSGAITDNVINGWKSADMVLKRG
jgi:hypothetical protein